MKKTLVVSFLLAAALLHAEGAAKNTETNNPAPQNNPAGETRNGYRVFFLGNSFTVNTHYHSEYFAKCAGFSDHTHKCAWSPGMQLSGGWGHWAKPESSAASDKGGSLSGWKRALEEETWDRFVVQPFYDNQEASIDVCNKFYDYATSHKSPDVQMIVKQIWFTREATSYETGRQPNSVAYFEALADGIQKAHPGSTVNICPTGLVIQELRRLTALGQVPGVARESDWYADPIHLSKIGNYADGITQFITLYKVNPVNFNIPANVSPGSWYGYSINEQTAEKIKEVAWKIASSYPRSGVTAGPVDSTPPTVPSNVAASKISSAGSELNWTASSDPESGIASYSIYQDGKKLPAFFFTNRATITNLAPLTKYTFAVRANNRVGLSSEPSMTVSVTTPAPAVPVTGLSLKPTSLSLNIAVDKPLVPTFVPPDADNQGVVWTSSDPAIATVDAEGSVAGKSAGTATITATARDNSNGTKSAAATVTILPNHPPTATFKFATARGNNPLAITFDGMASSDPDPRDGIFGWDWDFGDDSPHFYGANPNHTYAKDGTYTVSLIVLDNNGAFSAKTSNALTIPLPVPSPTPN